MLDESNIMYWIVRPLNTDTASSRCPSCWGYKACAKCGGSGGGPDLPHACGNCNGTGECPECKPASGGAS